VGGVWGPVHLLAAAVETCVLVASQLQCMHCLIAAAVSRCWQLHHAYETRNVSACAPAGKTLVPLEGDAAISRANETNLGNYVCDAFLRSVPQAVAAKAAGGKVTICLMNAGGIRSGFKVNADPVLMCDTSHIIVLLLCAVPHTVQYSEVSNGAVQQGTRHYAVQYSNVQYDTVQYSTVQYLINAMRTSKAVTRVPIPKLHSSSCFQPAAASLQAYQVVHVPLQC
jgi:hypothetical protein